MQPGAALSEVEISDLTADSRKVSAGCLFAALPGSRADGRDFIPQAIAQGAAAVLAPVGTVLPAPEARDRRSEEHTSELQSLMRISYAVFCLKNKHNTNHHKSQNQTT